MELCDDVTFASPMLSIRQAEKSRLIFDLRLLNSACSDPTFAMETLHDVPAFLANASCAAKLDLLRILANPLGVVDAPLVRVPLPVGAAGPLASPPFRLGTVTENILGGDRSVRACVAWSRSADVRVH